MIWINEPVKSGLALSSTGMESRMSDGATPSKESGTDPAENEEEVRDHFADLPDGSGCIEIWEHLSDQRNGEDSQACVNE